ncbi:GNAT family N-acetyltransferase [Streptomyces sp. NPDC059835]|uniref:GNAT family N-acetyltransferase n=1 Tax=Streptomyces sp. NPDC059835 TaxID=3346967 RepID=UPI00365073E8
MPGPGSTAAPPNTHVGIPHPPLPPGRTRRAHLGDLAAVNDLHHRCSLATRFARYASARRELKPSEWSRLVHPAAGATWLTTDHHDPDTVIAVTHLLKTRAPETYELALLIEDQWQGRGLGTWLTAQALRTAADEGCRTITATFGAGNDRAAAILRRLSIAVPAPELGLIDVTLPLDSRS